ncbi:GNAT family N-acetyltransferase [Candidatus Bathyarchaeota archaeon]|nr:GNAT family N-acetyltransferase [Candidatus Bathyarchaeota archaeon]
MIRRMKLGEEGNIRALLARLSYEDQTFWRKQAKRLEEYLSDSSKIPISEEIKGKNIILVAEEDSEIVGLCWCTIVDRGIDKQGEIAEFYVEKEYRGRNVGAELMAAAKQLFINEQVEVAFAWTHHGNETAIKLYKNEGFKEVDQLVMALVLSTKNRIQRHA